MALLSNDLYDYSTISSATTKLALDDIDKWVRLVAGKKSGCPDYGWADWSDDCSTGSSTTTGHYVYGSPTTSYKLMKFDYEVPETALKTSTNLTIAAGQKTVELPDGAKLVIDDAGNYHIEDKDAVVTYRANRIREFSPHLNASDLLADFVRYVGSLGVRQEHVLGLPIELFINWLVIEAAERDHDPIPAEVIPPARHASVKFAVHPQCRLCGRFVPRLHLELKFPFCDGNHAQRYVDGLRARRLEDRRLIVPEEVRRDCDGTDPPDETVRGPGVPVAPAGAP